VNARVVFDKAVRVNYVRPDHLATVWCEYAELEMRHRNFDEVGKSHVLGSVNDFFALFLQPNTHAVIFYLFFSSGACDCASRVHSSQRGRVRPGKHAKRRAPRRREGAGVQRASPLDALVRSASALVTFGCVLLDILHTQISRSICNFTHYIKNNDNNNNNLTIKCNFTRVTTVRTSKRI
jgi:hypothetical protein